MQNIRSPPKCENTWTTWTTWTYGYKPPKQRQSYPPTFRATVIKEGGQRGQKRSKYGKVSNGKGI